MAPSGFASLRMFAGRAAGGGVQDGGHVRVGDIPDEPHQPVPAGRGVGRQVRARQNEVNAGPQTESLRRGLDDVVVHQTGSGGGSGSGGGGAWNGCATAPASAYAPDWNHGGSRRHNRCRRGRGLRPANIWVGHVLLPVYTCGIQGWNLCGQDFSPTALRAGKCSLHGTFTIHLHLNRHYCLNGWVIAAFRTAPLEQPREK